MRKIAGFGNFFLFIFVQIFPFLQKKKAYNFRRVIIMQQTLKQQKQLRQREQILNGNLFKVILAVALPILFYNLCNYLYGIYDMMVVQNANIGEAADIVVLDQIKNMISTVGGSLATGGGILVSRRYGEKKIPQAKRCANALFSMALVVSGLTLIFIPLGVPFLKLLKTDSTTIEHAMGYYYVQIVILVITTMNSCFIALEKSKGNTFKLLCLNFGVIAIKVALTTLFAYGPFEHVTITWLAVATLIAQSFLFVSGMILCFLPSNILQIRFRELNFNKNDCLMIVKLSVPVFVGRFLFSYGKVYVNGVATEAYGKMSVGALGISNTIAGLLSNMINSFEDAGSTIVSQNYGNSNGKRIVRFFFINLSYILILSVIGTVGLYVAKEQIALFFAPGDPVYQEQIIRIFRWECLDIVFMGLSGAAMSIFYGFGKTRITMVLSMATLFVYRIPALLLLMNVFHMDYEACGMAMFISNTASGIVGILAVAFFLLRLKNNPKYQHLF